MKLSRKLAAAIFSASLLTGCEQVESMFACAQPKDWGVESLGLPEARSLPFDTARLNTQAIAPHYKNEVPAIAAMVSGNHQEAQAYFDRASALALPVEKFQAVDAARRLVEQRGLYFMASAQAWNSALPTSKAARLMAGTAYAKAADEARDGRFTSETRQQQFIRHGERFQKAADLLEPLTREDDVYGDVARAALIAGYFVRNRHAEAWQSYEKLIAKYPKQLVLYTEAMQYAQPGWSGKAGSQHATRLHELAVKNDLSITNQKLLAQLEQAFAYDINDNLDPKAWRPYWQARTAEAPAVLNYWSWLFKEAEVENWAGVDDLASRLISLEPNHSAGWDYRASWASMRRHSMPWFRRQLWAVTDP
jgi:tetratricopeptide (TPR) repeat protein